MPAVAYEEVNSTGTWGLKSVSKLQGLPVEGRAAAPAAAVTVTILSGQSLSGAIDLAAERAHRITLPAAWTAAAITFQASADGVTYSDLYNEGGEYSLGSTVVGASRTILLDQATFYGIRYLNIRSGTAAAAVNQGADRIITIVTVPR